MSESNTALQLPPGPRPEGEVIKRGRGRPKGSKNLSTQFQHYEPKKWEPWMDELVIYSLVGKKSNVELAKMFDITEGHVSNLLCTKHALERKEIYRQAVLDSNPDISAQMASIQRKAAKRVNAFLDNDKVAEQSPIAFTSLAKGILAMTFPKGDSPVGTNITNTTNIQNNVLATNPEYLERVTKGLEGSMRVSELHEKKRIALIEAANKDATIVPAKT